MSADEPILVEREVPNPAYEDLEDVLTAVERAKAAYADDLQRPAQLMAERVWTGPTAASTFSTELSGREGDLPGYFDELATAVRDRMSQVPKTRTVTTQVW